MSERYGGKIPKIRPKIQICYISSSISVSHDLTSEPLEAALTGSAGSPSSMATASAIDYSHKLTPEEEKLGYSINPRYIDRIDEEMLLSARSM